MKINVDNEKAKFKTRLESSFDEINLSDQGFLKKLLEEETYFTNVDGATVKVDQKSEYKTSAKRIEILEIFAKEKNEMNKKNEGIWFFFSYRSLLCFCLAGP